MGFSCYCLAGQRICITDAILLFSAKIRCKNYQYSWQATYAFAKIAWHSNALINQTDNHAQHLQSLKHSLELFEQAHEYLLTKDEQGNAVYLNTPLFDLYYASPSNLDAEVLAFITQAKNLVSQKEPINLASYSVGEVEALLKKLDTAVSLFEQQAVKKVD